MGHLGRRALDVGDAAWLDTSAGPWTVRVSLRVRSWSLLTTARRWGATSVLLSPSEGGGPTWLVLSGKTFVAGETSDSSPTSPTSLYLSLDDPALNLSSPSWRSFDSPPRSTLAQLRLTTAGPCSLAATRRATLPSRRRRRATRALCWMSCPLSSPHRWSRAGAIPPRSGVVSLRAESLRSWSLRRTAP